MLSYENLCYIGSTLETMKRRMSVHINDYKRWLNKIPNATNCSSFKVIENEGYEINVIEEVIGETEEECKEREQWWMDFYGKDGLVNTKNAFGTDYEKYTKEYHKKYNKEYRDNHKEELKQQKIEYYEKHKQQLLQYHKEYQIQNKEKIKEYQKQYRIKNKEQKKKDDKEYYQKKKVLLNSNNLNITTTD